MPQSAPTRSRLPSSASVKTSFAQKRPRSVCRHEGEHKQLADQVDALRQKVSEQTKDMMNLEKTILQFYYNESVHFEGSVVDPKSNDTASYTLSDGFHASTRSTEATDSAGPSCTASTPSSGTSYYLLSTISRLLDAKRSKRTRYAVDYADVQAKVAMEEAHVETELVKGRLALQTALVERKETERKEIMTIVRRLQEQCQSMRDALTNEQHKHAMAREAKEACRGRIRVLEQQKVQQMSNVDQMRAQRERLHEDMLRAQEELRQRERVVDDLRYQADILSLREKKKEKLTRP